MNKTIYCDEFLKNPQQDVGASVFLKDSTIKGWNFDNMAKAIEVLSQRNYAVRVMVISPQGGLCFVIMQKF